MRSEVCEICEDQEDGQILCTACKRVYHPACVDGTDSNPLLFVCHDCNSSTDPRCSFREESQGEILSCSFKTCPLRYHPSCFKAFHSPTDKLAQSASPFTCPSDFCHTCVADVNGLHLYWKLVRCI